MLTRWSDLDTSLAVFDDLHRRMNHLFQEYNRPTRPAFNRRATWPAVNLYDAGEELILEAHVPGLSVEDLQLTLNQDVLTLTGERKVEVPEGYSVHRQERQGLRFSRSFTFPCKVDMERTSAGVKEGVLTVRLAKAPEAKPRQITVKAQ